MTKIVYPFVLKCTISASQKKQFDREKYYSPCIFCLRIHKNVSKIFALLTKKISKYFIDIVPLNLKILHNIF